MQFRTEIQIKPLSFPIAHRDRILLLGSCFTENIGGKLEASGFQTDVNPFGILYNPLSVASALRQLIGGKIYTDDDLFEHQGLFASFSHHGKFSAPDKDTCLAQINQRMEYSSRFLRDATVLVVTFGTAFAYYLKSTGQVVSNCHKLPSDRFCRERLSVGEIVDAWRSIKEELAAFNPGLRVLFTVSPIRHWKDGAHGNQLSKASLLLAVEELTRQSPPEARYFPAYELVLDDLRDYRYYTDDMLHPSQVAVEYIWEKFSTACFDKETQLCVAEYQKIQQALQHRPFHPDSEAYRKFLADARARLEAFRKRFE